VADPELYRGWSRSSNGALCGSFDRYPVRRGREGKEKEFRRLFSFCCWHLSPAAVRFGPCEGRGRLRSRQVRVSEGSEGSSNRRRPHRSAHAAIQEQVEPTPPPRPAQKRVDVGRVFLWVVLSILSLGASPALATRLNDETKVGASHVSTNRALLALYRLGSRLRSALKGGARHSEVVRRSETDDC
jgi:hypothetical protein